VKRSIYEGHQELNTLIMTYARGGLDS